MPIVTASPRSNSNGEQVTEFLDTINTTPTTYTFLNTQERLKVKNNGYGSLQLTVNGSAVTVLPSESKEFYGSIDSFVIASNGGVQSFEVVGTNYKDEEFQLTGSILKELISGEDQTANLLVVENRYNYKNLNALATTTVKSTPGFLHAIIINTAGATANTATLYDSATASGTKIATVDLTTLNNRIYNVQFTLGLTVVIAGGTSADITVAYR